MCLCLAVGGAIATFQRATPTAAVHNCRTPTKGKNFLWGKGMGELGIDVWTAKMGAQYNQIFNGRRGNDQTSLFYLGSGTYDPNNPGWFDASTDQQAIANGNASSPRMAAEAEKEAEQLQIEIATMPKF